MNAKITPDRELLNHAMACSYCYPQSGKYCEVGKVLHAASKPSVDAKAVRR